MFQLLLGKILPVSVKEFLFSDFVVRGEKGISFQRHASCNIGHARSFPKVPWGRGASSIFPKSRSATDGTAILRVRKSFPFPSRSFLFTIVRHLSKSPRKGRFQRGPFCGLSVINASVRIVFTPLTNRKSFRENSQEVESCVYITIWIWPLLKRDRNHFNTA